MNDSVALAPPKTFRIGDCEIDPGVCVLRRAEDNDAVKVTPRSMDVLVYLAEHAGEVVTNDELLDRFWPSPMAASNAVYKSITELRHAFGDSPRSARYIETVPKRGYRLIAPVDLAVVPISFEPSTLHTPLRDRRVAAIAVSVGLLLACVAAVAYLVRSSEIGSREQRIAILPLQVLDENPANEVIAEGIATSLMTRLARLKDVAVTSPKYSFRPNLEKLTDTEIGKALGVDHVFSGALMSDGDAYQILVQLIRVEDGAHLYSQRFRERQEGSLKIQDQVADRIVSNLEILLNERHRQRMRAWGTARVSAYLEAEDARIYAQQFDPRSLKQAAAGYRRAIGLDPNFIGAYCGLAQTLGALGIISTSATERETLNTELKGIRDRVSDLNHDAQCLALIELTEISLRPSPLLDLERRVRQLIVANPESAEHYFEYQRILWTGRLFREAAEYSEKYQTDHLHLSRVSYSRNLSLYMEGPHRAVNIAKQGLRSRPNDIRLLSGLVLHLAASGQVSEAQLYLSHLKTNDPVGHWAYAAELNLRVLNGELSRGSTDLESAFADERATNYARGTVCFLLGDVERGVNYWRQMEPGLMYLAALYVPELEYLFPDDVIRNPRYQAVLDELGIGRQWQEYLREELIELAPITGIQPQGADAVEDPSRTGSHSADRS